MKNNLTNTRILLVANALEVGGLQNQAMLLGKYLQDNGAIVTLLGYGTPQKELVRKLTDAHISWEQVPYPWEDGVLPSLRSLLRFRNSITKHQPDIIIPFSGPSNLACNLLWKTTGAKGAIWNQRNAGHEPLPSLLIRTALLLSSAHTSNNPDGTTWLQSHGAHNSIHIPDAIAPKEYQSHSSHILPPADITATMIANFTAAKDHLTLIDAWNTVVQHWEVKGKSCQLYLAGKWEEPSHPAIQRRITHHHLQKSVTLLGVYPNIWHLLSRSAIYVHSAHTEGCPNAVQEAMQAGLPVVGTNIPGISALVAPKNRPYLASPKNSHELARHIIALTEDTTKQKELGEANKKLAQQYTPPLIGSQYASLIQQLLKTPPALRNVEQ